MANKNQTHLTKEKKAQAALMEKSNQIRKVAGAIYFYEIEEENLKIAIKTFEKNIQKAKTAFLTINPTHIEHIASLPEVYQEAFFALQINALEQHLTVTQGRIKALKEHLKA